MKLNVSTWNRLQNLCEIIRSKPIGCSGKHAGYSREKGCAPNETFECEDCGRIMPYCKGADDDRPNACDDCWALAHDII